MAIRTVNQGNLYRFAAIRQVDQGNLYTFAGYGDLPSDGVRPLDFYLYVRDIWQKAQAKAIAGAAISDVLTQASARKMAAKALDLFGLTGASEAVAGVDQTAVFTNLGALGADIDDWGTRKMQWAISGKNPQGTLYTWRDWYALGTMYAEAASYHAGEAFNSNYVTASIEAALKTVGDVKKLGEGGLDTFGKWLPWLAVGLGAVAVMYVTGTIKPFLPKPKR